MVAIGLIAFTTGMGLLRGHPLGENIPAGISAAIAAIPEEPPILLAVILGEDPGRAGGQKLRLVRAARTDHRIVAVTGDGMNDAPALHGADVAVAMGSGTAVAREASDLVLGDDSFATLVFGLAEGRRIVDSVQKGLVFLLSTPVASLCFILVSTIFVAEREVLLPLEILWMEPRNAAGAHGLGAGGDRRVRPRGHGGGRTDARARPPRLGRLRRAAAGTAVAGRRIALAAAADRACYPRCQCTTSRAAPSTRPPRSARPTPTSAW